MIPTHWTKLLWKSLSANWILGPRNSSTIQRILPNCSLIKKPKTETSWMFRISSNNNTSRSWEIQKSNQCFQMDPGWCKTYEQCLYLNDYHPVYHLQFLLKLDHQSFVEQSLKEWRRLGVVRKIKSAYNSAIFCALKKGGKWTTNCARFSWLERKVPHGQILDERSEMWMSASVTLVVQTQPFSLQWTSPQVFGKCPLTTKTVTSRLSQCKAKDNLSELLPMGLLGCQALFQRLMEKVLEGIQNIIMFIVDSRQGTNTACNFSTTS